MAPRHRGAVTPIVTVEGPLKTLYFGAHQHMRRIGMTDTVCACGKVNTWPLRDRTMRIGKCRECGVATAWALIGPFPRRTLGLEAVAEWVEETGLDPLTATVMASRIMALLPEEEWAQA